MVQDKIKELLKKREELKETLKELEKKINGYENFYFSELGTNFHLLKPFDNLSQIRTSHNMNLSNSKKTKLSSEHRLFSNIGGTENETQLTDEETIRFYKDYVSSNFFDDI